MFDLGMQELIVIFIVALIVFGPKRLPELGRTIGKGLADLKRAMQDVKEQMDTELDMNRKLYTGAVHGIPAPEEPPPAGETPVSGEPSEGASDEGPAVNPEEKGKEHQDHDG